MTTERAEAIAYSVPYITAPVTFTSPVPRIQENALNIIEAIDPIIWFLIVISIFLVFTITYLWLEVKGLTIWIIYAIFMRQPVNLTNKLRIIFWFWFFAAIIITTNYSGALDSELTAPLDTDRIESLQELLEAQKSRKITVIVHTGNPILKMIKVSI